MKAEFLFMSDDRKSRIFLLLIVLQLLWVVIGLIKILPYQIDDAFIAYRYADNFLRYGLIAFNLDDSIVEGFTSQLWFWLLVAVALIFDIRDVSLCGPALGILTLCVGILSLWFSLSKKIGMWPVFVNIFIILSLPSVSFYAVTGLEELFFAFLILFVGLYLAGYYKFSFVGITLVVAAIWTRPEAPWILVMIAIRAICYNEYKESLVYGFALLAALLALFLFRYSVFGDVLPNTYYAKTPEFNKGIQYFFSGTVKFWWFSFLILIAAIGAYFGDNKNRVVFLFGLSWLLVPVLEGGDWMHLLRFFLPAMLLLAFSVHGLFVKETTGLKNVFLFSMLLPLFMYSAQYMSAIQVLYPRYYVNNRIIDSWANAWLDSNHVTRIAAVDMGTLFYQKKYHALDLAGLTDREIARMPDKYLSRKITATFLLEKNIQVVLFRMAKMPEQDSILSYANFDNDTELHLFFDPEFMKNYELLMMLGYPEPAIASDFWGYMVVVRKDLKLTPFPLKTVPYKGFAFVDYSRPVVGVTQLSVQK